MKQRRVAAHAKLVDAGRRVHVGPHVDKHPRRRDMAKLGQLVLAQGRWGERPIVSEAWVRDSLAPHMAGQDLYYYGYQWWLGRSLVNQQDLGWAAAVGLGGQRIVIVPALDLVVVVTAGMYKSPMQGRVPLGILNRVLHAVH